jgi:hypothetical protein
MLMRHRVFTLTAGASGTITLASIALSILLGNDDSLMAPATHMLGAYLVPVAWTAGLLFVLCICIAIAAVALGFRRSRW